VSSVDVPDACQRMLTVMFDGLRPVTSPSTRPR